MKTPIYTTKDFVKILSLNGYKFTRSKGDHFCYKKEGSDYLVCIPIGKRELNAMLTRRLIKEGNLKVNQ